MKKWFKKHRHGVQTMFEVLNLVFLLAELIIGMQRVYMLGKTGTISLNLSIIFWVAYALWFIFFIAWLKMREYNREHDRFKIHTHNIAADIVDEFEEVLDYHNITVPDSEREGGEDEARLYGETYDKLLSNIELRIVAILSACTREGDIELISDKFE